MCYRWGCGNIKLFRLGIADLEAQMTYLLVLMVLIGTALGWRFHFLVFAILTVIACVLTLGLGLATGMTLMASFVAAVEVGIALQVGFVLRLVLQMLAQSFFR